MKFEIDSIEHIDTGTIELPSTQTILAEIEEAIATEGSFLGNGKTALVHSIKGNPRYCMKIIQDQRLDDLYGIDGHPPHNDIDLEFELLSEVASLGGAVKIPKPCLTWKIHDENGKKVKVMFMTRMDAVSIKDVHEGSPIPEKLKSDEFFKKLKEFIVRLHEEAHIYHRDIASSNIMIEIATGDPVLIDFGDSIKLRDPDERPYTVRDSLGRVKYSYPNDLNALEEVKRLLEVKLLTIDKNQQKL